MSVPPAKVAGGFYPMKTTTTLTARAFFGMAFFAAHASMSIHGEI
jgi:hypothetical protein